MGSGGEGESANFGVCYVAWKERNKYFFGERMFLLGSCTERKEYWRGRNVLGSALYQVGSATEIEWTKLKKMYDKKREH